MLLVERYNELVLRQRVTLLISFLSLVYFFWYFLFLLPLSNNSKDLILENTYLSSLYKDANQIKSDKPGENKALGIISLNNKLSDLEKEVNILNDELKKYFSIASSDKEFMSVMEDLVTDTEGLSLQEIEQLPIKPVVIGADSQLSITTGLNGNNVIRTVEKEALDKYKATIYKHRISIKVKGNYSSLVRYLKKIESLSWGLFGQDIHYKVDQYPNAVASLVLYSLSLGGSISNSVNAAKEDSRKKIEVDNEA